MSTQVTLEGQTGISAHLGGTAAVLKGGYYTPAVSQPEAGTMQVDFTPSEAEMPAVDPVTVELPAGANGAAACILMTTQELEVEDTEANKSEIYVPGDPEAATKFMDDITANGGTALLLEPNGNLFYIQLPAKIAVGDGNVPIAWMANIQGDRGKSAYEFAVAGGYTGTEEEFAEKMAKEYLPLSGGVVEGEITVKNITANAAYFKTSGAGGVELSAIYDGENYIAYFANTEFDKPVLLSGILSPRSANYAANKAYVDESIAALDIPTVDDILAALPTWDGGAY